MRNKNISPTPRYNLVNLNTNSVKSKKLPKPQFDVSPFFYSSNISKFKSDEKVKQYMKFVKNITITYPIMIPVPVRGGSGGDGRDSFRKLQKQKEKSRDINSNRNGKVFSTRPTVSSLNEITVTSSTSKERKTTGKK